MRNDPRVAVLCVSMAAFITTLVAAPSAIANGPCGQDYTGSSACGLNGSPATADGSIIASNDVDYYVFHAGAETRLNISIDDLENPICSTADYPTYCGSVSVELYDSQDADSGGTGRSSPEGGITAPASWSTVVGASGTYYLEVSGELGDDANGNPTSVPYELQVTSSPAIAWPYTATTPPQVGWRGPGALGGGPLTFNPAAGSDHAGDEYVFWRGIDGYLWDKWYLGGKWRGPARITTGHGLVSAPAVAVRGSGRQDVFWEGSGGNLWESSEFGGGWHAATNLGGRPLGSAPTAGTDGAGNEYVFWRGTDGSLWDYWYTGGRWHGPSRIAAAGRNLASAPAVAVRVNGEQDIFWKGTDGNLWELVHTAGWQQPVDLGAGPLGSGPTAGVDASGNDYVFWRGTDGSLWDEWRLEGTWHGPARIESAGTVNSPPSVAVQADGDQNVYWVGPARNLWEAWYN